MNLHLDLRGADDFAFYIDGDLQFDTRDEALYHEGLVLPALSLAARQKPNTDLRVLICGGGDGLALRECLRFPHVAHVDLVDYSPDVVEWGRTRFAELNAQAFADPRAHVHIADAWEFLQNRQNRVDNSSRPLTHRASVTTPNIQHLIPNTQHPPYDIILCDFTVPRREEDTRVYSVEWYELLHRALAADGLLALNALSPEATPEAFWCVNRTVRAARLNPQPYRVCLPSFRAQGYGTWAFLLAGPRLRRRDLADLACPISTRQYALSSLWPSAQFTAQERHGARRIPSHSLQSSCLLPLLLNPGMASAKKRISPVNQDVSEDALPAPASNTSVETPYDLNTLLAAIPISHPYHTRVMIESLAEQVVGTVRKLDVQRLVGALLRRAQKLPLALQTELTRLQMFLQDKLPRLESMGMWGRKLFVILVILMTMANAIAPDNAFGKGTGSFGHASMSRGYSGGSFGRGESGFGGGTGRTTGSSFGGGASGYGSSFGSGGRTASGSFHATAPVIRSTGFGRSYGTGQPTNIEGVPFATRSFTYIPRSHTTIYVGNSGYYNNGYYNNGNNNNGNSNNSPSNTGSREEHKAFFVADDDMLVLDNGDIVITLSDEAYLLVSGPTVSLMSSKSPNPLVNLYPDPVLFNNIIMQLQDQQAQVAAAIPPRREWLQWVGWTSAFAGVVAEDKTELHNLEDLQRRLETALKQIQPPPVNAVPSAAPEANGVELFVDALLLQNGQVALRAFDNNWISTDGKKLFTPGKPASPCPPEMQSVLKSVLTKLQTEFKSDIANSDNDLQQLAQEKASLDKDMAEYTQLESSNGGDPSYEVDYGTESIPVSDALNRTQADLTENQTATAQALLDQKKKPADLAKIEKALKSLTP